MAGQHCHAAACDDGDRADFKRREGQSVLHFPVLCIILQLLHWLYALPVFLPLFCGSVDQCKRDQDQKHHYFSSQFPEDLQQRGKVSSTTIEKLRSLGVLNGMSETNQLSLF